MYSEDIRKKVYGELIEQKGKMDLIAHAVSKMHDLTVLAIGTQAQHKFIKYKDIASRIAEVKLSIEVLEEMFTCSDLVDESFEEKFRAMRDAVSLGLLK